MKGQDNRQKCCNHENNIDAIKLGYHKSIQIIAKSKNDEILFLLDVKRKFKRKRIAKRKQFKIFKLTI